MELSEWAQNMRLFVSMSMLPHTKYTVHSKGTLREQMVKISYSVVRSCLFPAMLTSVPWAHEQGGHGSRDGG